MEKILATGGGSFIRSHLARYLNHQGHLVRIADIKFDDCLKEDYWTKNRRWI